MKKTILTILFLVFIITVSSNASEAQISICQEGYNSSACLCGNQTISDRQCCFNGSTWRSQTNVCEENLIFEENWDSGMPTNGWPNIRNTRFNGWWTVDWGGTDGYAELSENIFHSAPRSLYELKRANQYETKGQMKEFTPVTEFRMRFYVYFDNSYANLNTGEEGDYIHFIFLQNAWSGRGVRMDIVPGINDTVSGSSEPDPPFTCQWDNIDCPTCSSNNFPSKDGFFTIASPSGLGSSHYGVTYGRKDLCFAVRNNLNRWILVEWAYKINSVSDGRVSLWIDGIERMKDELLPPDPGFMNIPYLIISGYASVLKNYDLGFYIDDIVATKDYNAVIGPTSSGSSGDTTPPAAPTGLTVN